MTMCYIIIHHYDHYDLTKTLDSMYLYLQQFSVSRVKQPALLKPYLNAHLCTIMYCYVLLCNYYGVLCAHNVVLCCKEEVFGTTYFLR